MCHCMFPSYAISSARPAAEPEPPPTLPPNAHPPAHPAAGPRGKLAVTICQGANIVAFTIAYTITAAVSMQEMAEHICGGSSGCLTSTWELALIFGGIQLFFSQLPNLEGAWWMSVLGAAMSLLYAGIALGLCIAQAGNGHGTLGGIETSTVDKIFSIANSLGAMAFAFSFSGASALCRAEWTCVRLRACNCLPAAACATLPAAHDCCAPALSSCPRPLLPRCSDPAGDPGYPARAAQGCQVYAARDRLQPGHLHGVLRGHLRFGVPRVSRPAGPCVPCGRCAPVLFA